MMLTLTICSLVIPCIEAQPIDLSFVPAQLSGPTPTCCVRHEGALSQMVADLEKGREYKACTDSGLANVDNNR